MFYRRKIILSLLEILGGEAEKLRLHKLLFLYSMKKQDPEYDFIPYKYGCYSHSAKADLNTMVKKGMLSESVRNYTKRDKKSYLSELKGNDKELLAGVIQEFGGLSRNALIRHTYVQFPFYAINSRMAKDILTKEKMDVVKRNIPNQSTKALFTIGYEGISLEKYLFKLIENNVGALVDVRRNPLSMKFGFSKSQLKKYCQNIDIAYYHIPKVGIVSDKRQNLATQADYDALFKDYCNTTLKETADSQYEILDLLNKHNRIALTCFEAEPCQCHRSHLAKHISELPEFEYQLAHL